MPKREAQGRRKRPAHRPSKLSERRLKTIIDVLKLGLPQIAAIQAAGIARSTFQQWMAEGRDSPEGHPLRKFADAVEAAHSVGELARVKRIDKAAKKDPVWDAWLLTHSPATKERWSLKQKVVHGGTIGFSLRDLQEIKKARAANKEGPPPASTSVD